MMRVTQWLQVGLLIRSTITLGYDVIDISRSDHQTLALALDTERVPP